MVGKAWFYGWWIYWRAVYLMRTKRHGVGRQPWTVCFMTARHARFIVYGQHRLARRIAEQHNAALGRIAE